MKIFPALLLPLAAALSMASAQAQLKPPRDPLPTVPMVLPASSPKTVAPAPAAPAPREHADKESAGKLAAHGWLLLLDRRDWGRAWESSGNAFRGSVPLPAWLDAIPKLREPLGAFVERTPAESNYKTTLPGRPEGEYVTTIFVSKFEKREVQEVVTMVREADGKWRVTGYSTR
ncbi:MAG: DUF4019 domain-containing protein [Ramlibacter sp.]|nr:DUF4019 domain-containing protein [Ramlibacter sp.]